MSVPKIVIHTDVFLDHLTGDGHPSILRLTMRKFFCYATVFQAMELFSLARVEQEVKAVEECMAAMKLLGVNPKNARRYGELLAANRKASACNILLAGLCIESRLPILTDRKKDFSGIRGLVVIPTTLIEERKAAADILKAAT